MEQASQVQSVPRAPRATPEQLVPQVEPASQVLLDQLVLVARLVRLAVTAQQVLLGLLVQQVLWDQQVPLDHKVHRVMRLQDHKATRELLVHSDRLAVPDLLVLLVQLEELEAPVLKVQLVVLVQPVHLVPLVAPDLPGPSVPSEELVSADSKS